jgi:asparagine synthase (glutamine-hydrolysing)
MSGIAGIVNFDGKPVEPGLIEKMTSAMAHRGPDEINHWVKGSVALGQCMLRTTPESLEEHQPLTNEDKSFVLVMDGRLDNREQLRRALLSRGARLRTRADAELVLRAYETWGEESPPQLVGDFAFAIWDVRQQRFFLARDHIGVKPFYYFDSSDYLAFASDEEAFLGMPGVSRDLNEDFIASILLTQFYGGNFNRGWLKGILKLPPGSTITIERSGRKFMRTYWALQPLEESRFASDQECEEAFRSVFGEAVRCRLRTLGNPALMLSGGIDSASIAAMAREILRNMPQQKLHTFSVVSDDPASCAETRNIESICTGYEQHAHCVSVPSMRGSINDDDLKEAAWTCAHPVGNSILIPAMMYLAASRRGHRVVFDGIDGDLVTYTPLRYMTSLLRSGALRDAWIESRQASINNTYLKGVSPLIIFARSAWEIYAPNAVKSLKQRIWTIRGRNPFRVSLIKKEFAKDLCLRERLDEQQSYERKISLLSDQERHIHALAPVGIVSGMEAFDAVAARYGIEPRHPWSDTRLVEFYLRLPLRYKVRNGWTKYLVRKATAPSLQSQVAWHRGKGHLGMRLVRRLMEQSRASVHGALQAEDSMIDKYVDRRSLRILLDHFATNTAGEEIHDLFMVASLAKWSSRVRLGS